MAKRIGRVFVSLGLSLALLSIFWISPSIVRPVQAANGIKVTIPASNIVPTMDGVCNPSEYSDAIQATITVGPNPAFPVFLKHTATDAYFCFGDAAGIPLPNGGTSSVTVYVDSANDGAVLGNNSNDFGVWMPYDSAGAPWASSWGSTTYDGADPGGWQAVKNQTLGSSPLWQVEFRITRQLIGGWNHPVGLALFYHWWQGPADDYSWPADGIWAAPHEWAEATFTTGSVNVGSSATIPVLDGQCGSEYSDASSFTFNTSGGVATAYIKHSATDLYVCLSNLAIPALSQQNSPNAALYINRSGIAGDTPGPSAVSFTISYNGTHLAGSGDGSGFSGPDPGGNAVALFQNGAGWNAEFQISGAALGNWFSRTLGLSVAQQNVNSAGDDYGWPAGNSHTIPNTWGMANLLALGNQVYLPSLSR